MSDQTAITTTSEPPAAFLALSNPNKQEAHRLNRYADYVASNGGSWSTHNLNVYRDGLLADGLANSTVKAHLSTVRSGLRRLADDRDYLYSFTAPDLSLLERKALVDEITVRIEIATRQGKIETVTKQDTADSEHIRLLPLEQVILIKSPDRGTLPGLRDAALIGMALATGLRAAELCSLTVDDLRQTLGGECAVRTIGKGRKQRLVPYGAEQGILMLVDTWLQRAGITEGHVFRGVNNKGDVLPNPITTYTFSRRLRLYYDVRPHDLRRTYAVNRYTQGMDILAIRDNLGHADIRTTQGYIGAMDVSARVPAQGLNYG